ncbi:MAG: hypothetical protein CSA65_07775 [Proteobacteria bacterium]|nr:MAG: hypothetical protein CSA65_07775 [Pseudomonadota bacterium]
MSRVSPSRTTHSKPSAERVDVHGFGRFRDRDGLLAELMWAANADLAAAQLYLAREGVLRGYLAVRDGEIDETAVRELQLPLSLLSVARRTIDEGIPYIGPLPPTDPFAALVDPARLEEGGVALIPMRVADKPLGLLVGHPRGAIDRALRDTLVVLADEAVLALGRLISDHRAALRRAETARQHDLIKRGPVDAGNGNRGHDTSTPTLAGVAPVVAPLRVGATSQSHVAVAPVATAREPSDPSNRRAFRRESLRVEVHYRTEWGYFTGFMEDISRGGIFVTTYTRPPIGDQTELSFSIPAVDGEPFECEAIAEVRWLREPDLQTQQLPGMGLAFVKMPARSYRAICAFVEA